MQHGHELTGDHVILRYMIGQVESVNLAVIVSRKVGKAIERNRMKRRLRKIFNDKVRPRVRPGLFLLIARKSIVDAKYDQLERDVLVLTRKAVENRR